jgi:transposase-like protein
MAYTQENTTQMEQVLELLTQHGFEGMGEAIGTLMNAAMVLERQNHLRVGYYQRGSERQGQANGFKPKTMKTRVGEVQLQIPQVRDSTFYPESLERGQRSETALTLALAEMYVNGVATRKVANITETLCGLSVSSTQVSEASKKLDTQLSEWRERKLGAYPHLILDARYEKVRQGGTVVSCAVLIAVGIDEKGKRSILGVSVKLSEQEVHWRDFLKSLVERGLHGIELITSDAHEGLKAALRAVFPSVFWQRCQFHLQQNAQKYVPKQSMKTEVASSIRAIFNASDRTEADRQLRLAMEKYKTSAPALAAWMETSIPEGLTVFDFPEKIRKRLRTSNMLERINKEVKRRTRVASLFPNEQSCLRLVTAILVEISEEWEAGPAYLKPEDDMC